MFFGHIADADSAAKIYPAPVVKAIHYLKTTDFEGLAAGTYEIDGKNIYALVMDLTTTDKDKNRPEVHRRYIDVQFLLRGKELIGFARDTGHNAKAEDLPERDVCFYQDAENEVFLKMCPGNFAIFFPFDVHRPGCRDGEPCAVRKVVVKIALDIL